MFVITIRMDNDHDIEALRDLLDDASEDGTLENAFDVKVDEE